MSARPVEDQGGAPEGITGCGTVEPNWCEEHRSTIHQDCVDLGKQPGKEIFYRLDGRTCYCICPSGDEAARPDEQRSTAPSTEELRAQMTDWLGVAEPVSDPVLTAAFAHPGYRRRLHVARQSPQALDHLLANPPELPAGARTMVGLSEPLVGDQSSGALARRAGRSLARFAASGFDLVDEATRARRWDACQSCPHLREPSQSRAHRVVKRARADARVCGLCGCVASMKVRPASERCPGTDPGDPGLSRWGERRKGVVSGT